MNYLPFVSAESWQPRRGVRWQRVALFLVFFWFLLGGIAHFLFTDFEAHLLPPQVPDARDVVLITGLLEVAGAFGLLIPWTRRAAGWGLFLLTLVLAPANLYLLRNAAQSPLPEWLLWLRVPLQLVLLWLTVWGSRWRPVRRMY